MQTQSVEGFILSRHWRDTSQGVELELWLVTDEKPVRLIIPQQFPVCFFRKSDCSRVDQCLHEFSGCSYKDIELKNFYGEPVCALYTTNQRQLKEIGRALASLGVAVWEDNIKPVERFLMERFITSGIKLQQLVQYESGAKYISCRAQRLSASAYAPELSLVSLDIETSLDAQSLYSIAVYNREVSLVFMVGEATPNKYDHDVEIVWCDTERQCLQKFLHWFQEYDADVVMGWHVVQFDFWVLQQLADKLKVPLRLGRGGALPFWREDSQNARRHYLQIPGRMILDGIELLRMAFYSFESFSLQSVANEILGEGKLLQGESRGEAITTLFSQDKYSLAAYNLKDCQLVWDIFEKTDLLSFAVERSRLTGLAMDRMGGSVASFEYAYLPRLHRAGYVAPSLGELTSDVVSPGGYVMRSIPGIYQHVLVLDFKSLYPSIIRTFMIDPCGFWQSEHEAMADGAVVDGFNGARFSRERSILPGIIEELWKERDKAKVENNQSLSQAIKIIMNSFYGVLGSTGCRFFDPRVCSSITLRGHEILQSTKEWIEAQGYQVIYGDTDSVFVWLGDDGDDQQAQTEGERLARDLNRWWREKLRQQFNLQSALEIEFETHYQHFFMPTIRNSDAGSKKRYAGIKNDKLIFKGLENVRNDWTPLAKKFQHQLYLNILKGEAYQWIIVDTVADLLQGKCKEQIIYRKRLRRNLEDYEKSNPPHVNAARRLAALGGEILGRGDVIEYIITTNGPEPLSLSQSPIDYNHYIEKQLKPIADSILVFLGEKRFDDLLDRQQSLL